MWYCGDTYPVSKLNTSVTELACLGDDLRFIPNHALGFHFGILLFACKLIIQFIDWTSEGMIVPKFW
jgi:hypothetical protein